LIALADAAVLLIVTTGAKADALVLNDGLAGVVDACIVGAEVVDALVGLATSVVVGEELVPASFRTIRPGCSKAPNRSSAW